MNTGSVSDGARSQATSGDENATPSETSAFAPLDTTPTDTITWQSSTDEVLTNWDSGLGMYIGGIPVTMWTAERPNDEQLQSWEGSESVATYLDRLEDEWGVQLRGTYHVFGYIHADEGDCDMAGYVRVNAENPFATPLIIALWVAGALLFVIIVVGRRVGTPLDPQMPRPSPSKKRSRRARRPGRSARADRRRRSTASPDASSPGAV